MAMEDQVSVAVAAIALSLSRLIIRLLLLRHVAN